MKKNAFTLVEILVVVGAIMMIMISISGIMSGVFKSQNKNESSDKIAQGGSWILDELKKNVLNADSSGENGQKFNCPVGGVGSSLSIINVKDGEKTTISCENGRIASTSAERNVTFYFNNQDLVLTGCNNFVSCSTLPSLQLSNVKFNFSLEAGNSVSSGTTKSFSVDVTIRN